MSLSITKGKSNPFPLILLCISMHHRCLLSIILFYKLEILLLLKLRIISLLRMSQLEVQDFGFFPTASKFTTVILLTRVPYKHNVLVCPNNKIHLLIVVGISHTLLSFNTLNLFSILNDWNKKHFLIIQLFYKTLPLLLPLIKSSLIM